MSGLKPGPKPRFRALGRKNDLVDRVVQAIEGQVLNGGLPVGSRLPAERELSEKLAVSRTVVREAVRILVTKGLLATRHGIGTEVRAMTREEAVKPMSLFFRSSNQEVSIEDLHQVRSSLEVACVGIAAEQADESDILDLRRLCAEMDAAATHPQRFADKDTEFHRRLAQATHNPLMTFLLDSMHDLVTEIRKRVANQQNLHGRVMPTHVRIVDCIAGRDSEGARDAMREHLTIAFEIQRELAKAAAQASA